MKLGLKTLTLAVAVATLGQSTISRGHGMTPEFALAIMLATVRVCEMTYPDMQTSLVSARNAWKARNAPLLAPIEKILASKGGNMQSLVDMFVEETKKEKGSIERSSCEQLSESLADARNDAQFKAWFAPGNREFSIPVRPRP